MSGLPHNTISPIDDDEMLCVPCEGEGRIAKGMRGPHDPTADEIKEHMMTHIPFRDWCPHCCKGKGISTQHRKEIDRQDEVVPTVSIDYAYTIGDDEARDGEMAEDYSSSMPTIVMKDRKSKTITANVVARKGIDSFAIKKTAQEIVLLGYNRITLKSDSGNIILALSGIIITNRSDYGRKPTR